MKSIISLVLRYIPRPYLQLVGHWAARGLSIFYIGNKVECPVCNSKYRKFLPYGRNTSSRENALCPSCLSLERHRLMALYMKRKTNFYTANLKVLHVAPEYCFIDRFEQMKNLDYITADIESPLAKVKMDIHQIPFPENTFDVAICNHVMEHVDDYILAMSELHRVLKPGGWALIQSPQDMKYEVTYEDPTITDPKEREIHFLQNDHLRLFGRNYGRELEKGGFKVTEDRFVMDELSKAEVQRYSLPGEEIVYFCQK
ncbi:SAM-dependent methyltransferase [Dyadobacter sp. BE34]|uniref:SAM-dependent methyltransferase n=1 Tax=Dyadobacter fermentans TaxID=94254 RepID=A0ABU1QYA7_9BACT|nr:MULTISPECIES: class I SAM-dependent methyltransferase [Dyadobacter]MDR6805715.1 SAM-dependent methyltransferase [Dyadobacter fermentans]MDR7042525.1 SAM-dependent methyltransferase [Dyadobacter sp. BE242]MDR7196837.1 SAM-dependent methyltransferase [Dyadobacter sp. BE34]MDR7215728.1 SAM-dependent methyltransferase [Dyadobacter sp. BE31]MDR7263264.1 SAM-dependent methyltransferase [Dyadobacter sp. BE32]